MALYPAAVKKLIPPGANDPRITPRLAILHVDAGNASSLFDFFNGRSGGVESHFFVKKDGVVEQYRDTAFQADANLDANDFAVSIETQGFGTGTWTAQQLAAIKALLLWLHATHNIPLRKVPTWDGAGVGYHTLFGSPSHWTPVAKSCPGPDRIKQFRDVLVPWMADQNKSKHGARLTVLTANLGRGVGEDRFTANVRKLSARPHAVKCFQEIDEADAPEERAVLAREMPPGWAALQTRVPINVPPPWQIVDTRITHGCDGLAKFTPARKITQALSELLRDDAPPLRLVFVDVHAPIPRLQTVTRRRQYRRALREVIAHWHNRGYTVIWMGDMNQRRMRKMHPLEEQIVGAGRIDKIRVVPHPEGVQVEVLWTRAVDLNIDGHDGHWARLRLTRP